MAADDEQEDDHPGEGRRAGPTDPTLPAKPDAEPPSATPRVHLPDRYQGLGLLGGGGMGHVIRALDRQLGREVAIKTLTPALQSEDGLERLQREARAIAALRHPAIVGIYDIDVGAGILVMELVTGGSLAELLSKESKLSEERALSIARPILSALAAMHAEGIIHRDVKPSNILIGDDDQPKLCDFGVVHTLDSELTMDGVQPGTPAYMAPEQRDGGRADERSDVYSAGVTLFEMLTGRRFKNEPKKSGPDLAKVMRAEGVAPWLAAAVARAVAEHPAERYASARELLDALEGRGVATGAKRRRIALLASFAALLSLGAFVLFRSQDGVADTTAEPLRPDVVAFVPFEEHTGDEGLAFTAHGVPRALGTRVQQAMPNAGVASYDALRDALPPGDHLTARWLEVARERGAQVVVGGRIEPAPGGSISIAAVILRLRDTDNPERVDEVVVTGRPADIDQLIADATSRIALRLYGRRPSADALGTIHSLEALRGHHHGVDALRRARFDDAVDALEEVVALEPDYPEAWYHLSIARTWAGGLGQRDAFRAIDRALALVQGRREQMLLRAMRLMTEERSREAAELLEPLRAEYPRDRDVLYTLGEAYHHGGDVAEGLAAFRAALHVSPGFLPSIVHPTRVYRASRDERNARECIDMRRRFGEEDQAQKDEVLLDFAMRRYDEILARPVPAEPRYARRGTMLAHLGSLLVTGEDERAVALLTGDMSDLRHTVIRWSAPTVLTAIAYRRGDSRGAREHGARAAMVAAEHDSPYYRGEARSALGIVRALAGDVPGARTDLSAVESEDYGARTPRTVIVFRALAGRLVDDEALLEDALETEDRDVRMLAQGLRHEMRGDHERAAGTLALALDAPTEGYFDIVILDALARNRLAIGDGAGARAACNEIERPAVYHPYREPALASCKRAAP